MRSKESDTLFEVLMMSLMGLFEDVDNLRHVVDANFRLNDSGDPRPLSGFPVW